MGWHNASGVNHLAEGGAITQEQQSNLRVMELPDGFQDGAGLVHSLVRVFAAERRVANGPAKELEVGVPHPFYVRRKS